MSILLISNYVGIFRCELRCECEYFIITPLLLGENFQIMNYGIGGKISGHVDSRGEIIDVNNTVSDNINGK